MQMTMKASKPMARPFALILLTAFVSMWLADSGRTQGTMIWSINANGAKEVTSGGTPNQGDPDGSAVGTLQLNSGSGGNTGSAIINLTLAGIGLPDYNLGGWHIHQATANTTGPIVLDFGQINTYLSGNIVSANISGLSSSVINSIFADSAGYYLNIHSGAGGPSNPYPGGAVRDQLTTVIPEPSTFALFLLALIAFAILPKRRT